MPTKAELLDIANQALAEGDEATANAAMDAIEKLSPTKAAKKISYREQALLSASTPSQMAAGQYIAANEQSKNEAETFMEGLRNTNPAQADILDSMSPFQKAAAGVGSGMADIYHGLPFTPENQNLAALNALEESSGGGTAARIAGQILPFAPAGIQASALKTLGGRILGSAAVGGSEGAAIASGTGGDTSDVVGGALLGSVVGAGAEAVSPYIVRGARALIKKVRGEPTQPLFDAAGNPSQELNEVLQQTGLRLEDLSAEAPVSEIARDFAGSGIEGRLAQVSDNLQVNPERLRAANELGVTPPIATLSDQSSVQEIAGAVAAAPGSKASEILNQYTSNLTKRAEDLIEEAGGDLDKGLVSNQLKEKIDTTIKNLATYGSTIYKKIDEAVPANTIVNASPLRAFLTNEAKKSQAGINGLSKVERDVYEKIQGKPTYFDIDKLRKDIGASIGRTEGTYITAPVAELKEMYKKLSALQEGAANQVGNGAGELWKQAKKIDIKKFDLQENSEFLFGKGNVGAVIPKVEASLKQLAKGDTKNFNQIISAVPSSQKGRVLTTAIDGLIRKTQVDGKTIDANGFTKWYGELSSSPTNKKALTDNLPAGADKSLDNLYLLTQGLANINKNKIKTGIVPETFKQIDRTDSLVGRLFNIADKASAAPVVGSVLGPGVRVVSNVAKMATKERTPAVQVADDLLASPEFRTAVLAQTKEKKIANLAEARLKKTEAYKAYMKEQNKSRAASISALGLIPYLMNEDEDQ